MSWIQAFNKQIDNFMTDLGQAFSDNPNVISDIYSFKSKLNLMRKINARKVVETVMYYIYPYKIQILNGDEEFFMNHDYDSELNEYGEDDGVMRSMHFKTLYRTTSIENREAIKKYFKVLLTIGEKALNLA